MPISKNIFLRNAAREPARGMGPACSAALACALALALACALAWACAPAQAFAEHLPDGSGEIDVAVITEVDPAIDPDARLAEVELRTVDETGAPVAGARLAVALKPPNAEPFEASVGETDAEGRLRVGGAVVGARHAVSASKEGYNDVAREIVCEGRDGEVWEIVLERDPRSASGDPAAAARPLPGADAADGPVASKDDGGANANAETASAKALGDGPVRQSGPAASSSASDFRADDRKFPFGDRFDWLPVVLGALALALAVAAALLLAAAWRNRAEPEGGEHGQG